jgi:hypothetical protein
MSISLVNPERSLAHLLRRCEATSVREVIPGLGD